MKRLNAVLVVCALVGLSSAARAEASVCSASTADRTNVLVELFTSEGCSSCPPADRWLSALGMGPAVPARVVPIAWHVDYWDYIGWKDRFAQAGFSARQRELAQIRREPVVYTPQVLVQGQDFRRWSGGGLEDAVARINARPARARIALSIVGRSDTAIDVEVRAALLGAAPQSDPASYTLTLAAYANKLTTQVAAGENEGRSLGHDHVAFGSTGPIPLGPKGSVTQRHRLALPRAVAPGASGVVAFVQSTRTAEILQALMLPACPG